MSAKLLYIPVVLSPSLVSDCHPTLPNWVNEQEFRQRMEGDVPAEQAAQRVRALNPLPSTKTGCTEFATVFVDEGFV
jgi:hypothetical protein